MEICLGFRPRDPASPSPGSCIRVERDEFLRDPRAAICRLRGLTVIEERDPGFEHDAPVL
jgi:hypothetical protein